MSKNITDINIDNAEMDAAEAAAEISEDVYVHKFKKPFTYEGRTYETLTFDWDELTGNDSLAIEAEMQAVGSPVVVREISGEYQLRMAARAARENIGADVIRAMPLKDCNRILNAARSFLLRSEA